MAGGGYLATLGTVGATNAWNPLGWVALGVVAVAAVIVIVDAVDDFAVTAEADDSNKGGRTTSPIGRRNTFNTRKKAYEAAKRAGGGKELRHDPNGHDDNRAHFHPNVSNQYRRTPKGVSMHDHYYYPR